MITSLNAILPLFLLMLFAAVIGRLRLFSKDETKFLTHLVFYIVLPIALLIDLSKTPLHEALYPPYLASYSLSSLAIILLTVWLSKRKFHRDKGDLVMNAMASYHGNTAYVALPIFMLIFHQIAPVAGIMLLQSGFTIIILALMEYHTNGTKMQFKAFGQIIIKNPLIIGIFIGLLLNLLTLPIPTFLQRTFGIVASASTFLAVFTLGLGLGQTHFDFDNSERFEIAYLVITKSILSPLATGIIGYFIFGLSTRWLLMVTMISAMPTANNLFIFSTRYQTGQKRASIIVALTTCLAFFTLTLLNSL